MSGFWSDLLSGLPGAFQAALHGVLTAKHYEQAIRDTMSCGGCTCSRGSFIGACLGAQVRLCALHKFCASFVFVWFIKCDMLIFLDGTWGNSIFLDVQNPAIRLRAGTCQKDNPTPPLVGWQWMCPATWGGCKHFEKLLSFHRTANEGACLNCQDGRSQMFLSLF